MNSKPPRRGVPQPLQGGPQRFGPYLLQARLAVGGTSEVYLAQADPESPERAGPLPPRFIVKRLLPHLVADDEGRTMFTREAELHAAVSHPNVVSVFGSGVTAQGEPYLAMEYIDGCDAFRLLRRTALERRVLPLGVSVYIAREVLAGLAAVHEAKDKRGARLGIIHRDVTPSNLYISRSGEVKLGDFGIARSGHVGPVARPAGEGGSADASLLGKFSYLSPEQVAGAPFDQRADLFSMATVLTEMLIGKPLFPGTGQLQVLLAIRDCKLGPLHDAKDRLPGDLVAVLQKALSREPDRRFQEAHELSHELARFQTDPAETRRDLAVRVTSVQAVSSERQLQAVRESARAMRAVRLDSSQTPAVTMKSDAPDAVSIEVSEDDTGVYPQLSSFVQKANGERLGPWVFSQLVEAIAAGTVKRGDMVAYIGMELRPVEDVADLAHLFRDGAPAAAAPQGPPGAYSADLSQTTLLDVLAHVLGGKHTGRLLVTRPAAPGEGPASAERREIFFLRGGLHHIAMANANELLGELLVRRGKLAKEELDLALAVLPRYGGRMADTLIGLGVVDGVDVFRAIREQGRDRMADLFLWREGKLELSTDAEVPAVDFPLDLDLPGLMLAGMEASHPGDAPMAFIEPRLDSVVVPNPRQELAGVTWPPLVAAVRAAIHGPTRLRDVVASVTKTIHASGADVARSLEVLLAMDLVRWG